MRLLGGLPFRMTLTPLDSATVELCSDFDGVHTIGLNQRDGERVEVEVVLGTVE